MEIANKKELFSVDEVGRLIRALGKGQETFTDDDIECVIRWGSGCRMGEVMLELALKGDLVLSVVDGEVMVGLADREKVRKVVEEMEKGGE